VIDPTKLRDVLRKIGDELVFYMLDEAIDLLPPDKLAKLVGPYFQLERLRPDAGALTTRSRDSSAAQGARCARGRDAYAPRMRAIMGRGGTLRSASQRIVRPNGPACGRRLSWPHRAFSPPR